MLFDANIINHYLSKNRYNNVFLFQSSKIMIEEGSDLPFHVLLSLYDDKRYRLQFYVSEGDNPQNDLFNEIYPNKPSVTAGCRAGNFNYVFFLFRDTESVKRFVESLDPRDWTMQKTTYDIVNARLRDVLEESKEIE